MGQPDQRLPRAAKQNFFSQPVRQITMMIIVLGLVGFGFYMALPRVGPVFFANLYLNGFIAFVFVIGIFACFWQVVQLVASVNWIERFSGQRPNVPGTFGRAFARSHRAHANLVHVGALDP